jgi:hypothetical protein
VSESVLEPVPAARPLASALRCAAFRGALFAIVVFLGTAVLFGGLVLLEGPPPRSILWLLGALGLASVPLGVTAAPLAFLESLLARHTRSLWRDRLGALGIAGCAFLLLVVASVQIAYTGTFVSTGSVENGAASASQWLSALTSDPFFWTPMGALAAPFAPVTLGRIRALRRRRVVAMTIGYGSLLAAPLFAVICSKVHEGEIEILFGLGLITVYALLPLALELADAIERRVSERLEKADA